MRQVNKLNQLIIAVKGAGEMASAVAWRLYRSNLRYVYMLEIESPLAVRRRVSFCEAIWEGSQNVEGVWGEKAQSAEEIESIWKSGRIAVLADPGWKTLDKMPPDVVVDAILAKKNLGTTMTEAPLVIGLGPGFEAGKEVHMVVETNRGHNLGKIIFSGSAEPNTGKPGVIQGFSNERVLRAPISGQFESFYRIGDRVNRKEIVGMVDKESVRAEIEGVLRGLIRSGTRVHRGMKIGDIDPRGVEEFCSTISDKARALAGGVLEGVLSVYNRL